MRRTALRAKDLERDAIEDKESYRWIEAIEGTRACLEAAQQMTVISDREADIYPLWDCLPDARTHVLIRVSRDRRLGGEQQTLFVWMDALECKGSYQLPLPAITGQRSAREAQMHIRFSPVSLARPLHCSDAAASVQVSAWAVDVREASTSVPHGDTPVHWRLLTSHPIESIDDALRCVQWYGQRWHIEQTFRILKRQGLDVEASQVEQADRLEKLAVLALSLAVSTLQLTLAREGHGKQPLTHCFAQEDQALLEHLASTLAGKTLKQQNPHTKGSLAWAAWIVARLGGWKGYASERPPDPITMLRDLKAIDNICYGWRVAKMV